MPNDTNRELGLIAYETYWHFAGGKSLITNQPLPMWDHLDRRIQAAWGASAAAVEREIRERGTAANRVKPGAGK
jgi:hypothetical protein